MVNRRAAYGRIKNSRSDVIFYAAVTILVTLFAISVLYPILYVISSSFSSREAVSSGKVVLWPVDFSVEGYEAVFKNKSIGMGYLNTILYTGVGTAVNIVLVMLCAYPMSRADLPHKNFFMVVFCFTMYFGGGLIPSYLLKKSLGIIDTLWVMVLPGGLSVYNMILARTFIKSNIPNDLFEAATIDGCSDFKFFIRIVLPLSKAIISVVILYSAVGHWNDYFGAMVHLNTKSKYPLTIVLREILIAGQVSADMVGNIEDQGAFAELADLLKYSLIMVSTVPIMLVYPFIQKYFVKGVMIGSLKG